MAGLSVRQLKELLEREGVDYSTAIGARFSTVCFHIIRNLETMHD